jgi:hypothetical protein
MSGTTPTYGFPYPTASDTPAGHTQMQSLATAVENTIISKESRIAAMEVKFPRTFEASTSADLTLGTASADATGGSVSFTLTATSIVIVACTFDMRLTVLGTGYCYGQFAVDGVTNGASSLFVAQSVETRVNMARTERLSLAAGAHTIKLQGRKDSSSGTALICAGSTLVVTVYG